MGEWRRITSRIGTVHDVTHVHKGCGGEVGALSVRPHSSDVGPEPRSSRVVWLPWSCTGHVDVHGGRDTRCRTFPDPSRPISEESRKERVRGPGQPLSRLGRRWEHPMTLRVTQRYVSSGDPKELRPIESRWSWFGFEDTVKHRNKEG